MMRLSDHWLDFVKEALPHNELDIDRLRLIFYAGALESFNCLHPEHPSETETAYRNLKDDLKAFQDSIKPRQ